MILQSFLVIPRANRPIVKVRSVLKRSEEEGTSVFISRMDGGS